MTNLNQPPRQCGTCQHYNTKYSRCYRYPPVPADNRHARYPAVFYDGTCGEWQIRLGLQK